jgi:hypothetical protein
MKKVVLASLLACAVLTLGLTTAFAQTPVQLGSQQDKPIQMSDAELTLYNNAMNQSDPKAKAAGIEAYLTAYPNSAVKQTMLEILMAAYGNIPDIPKALDAADRLLQVDPGNLRALYIETGIRKANADSVTDPAAKQAALDTAAGYARRGVAALAMPKPVNIPDAEYQSIKDAAIPTFYSAIGFAAFNKNDSATAIDAYKKELALVPLAATKTPGSILMDTFFLAEAYSQSTPSDLLDCAFYASRVVAYAPAALKPQFSNYANFCYKKYHDGMDGYDAVLAAATANLNPPAGLFASIKPAPTQAEKIHGFISTTADYATLATEDKELVFQFGSPDDAAKVWDSIKGKSVQIPGALVVSSSPTVLKVAVTDDAKQSNPKTADFTFNMAPPETIDEPPAPSANATPAQKAAYKTKLAAYNKAVAEATTKAEAIAAATAVGQTVTLTGTYDSFTANPIQIIMKDGAVILPKPTKPAAPVHHTAAHPAHR